MSRQDSPTYPASQMRTSRVLQNSQQPVQPLVEVEISDRLQTASLKPLSVLSRVWRIVSDSRRYWAIPERNFDKRYSLIWLESQ